MFGIPLAFASPWILLGLITLPVIWWLLRLTPPRPQEETFPPTRILAKLKEKEETPAQSPWWLTLLRLILAAFVITAMAGPVLYPNASQIGGEGPVLIVVDDGWASGQDWENRRDTALQVISEAQESGRTIILQSTTGRTGWNEFPISAADAAALLNASDAIPLRPDHEEAADVFKRIVNANPPGQVIWLSDGLAREGTDDLADAMSDSPGETALYQPDVSSLAIIGAVRNEPSSLTGTLIRALTGTATQVDVVARDSENLVRARSRLEIPADATQQQFVFEQPVELRNQFVRLEIENASSTGAVKLLDENNRRRLVGLISGEGFDRSQPLLSPLYYISRALEPFSDLRRTGGSNIAAAIPDLVNQQVSAIIMADVGTLPQKSSDELSKWIEEGGMLIRFAGPRLGSSPNGDLLPVDIRPGDRSLGGALSWETPKPLAAFERESPFFGLQAPRDVLIKKQLLALQEADLDQKTWSRLDDGTPLVTAEQRGAGWLVLFHVGTDSEWSNLPLSGTFVEMLRRTVNLSYSGNTGAGSETELVLPPLKLLNAQGAFTRPTETTKPITIKKGETPKTSIENPPGFYGTEDGVRALNLFTENNELSVLGTVNSISGLEQRNYRKGSKIEIKNWILAIAAILFIVDTLIVLWMAGSLRNRFSPRLVAPLFAAGLGFALVPFAADQAKAQDIDFSAALETKLAYVITGIDEVDRISEAGMRGLTRFISSRTALEPGEPVGLDVSEDELSFYSLIYWPVDPRAPLPDEATMARVDGFMKQGGSILFDTRDQLSGVLGGTSSSPASQALQQILSTLDIPPLEPVPSDHVLTKAFYLLDHFPGRYNGGDLWVKVSQGSVSDDGRPARAGDGVSSILITSNDFAGAWAVDKSYRPMLPTVPSDPVQRNYAYRSGVNLMMYALTGNYKADQVHLPALLERLGQ